jgi:hypothetical protein
MAGMPTLSLDADNGFLLLLAGATTLGLLIWTFWLKKCTSINSKEELGSLHKVLYYL